ncbi:MAG: transposase [Polyangiales bacterium]
MPAGELGRRVRCSGQRPNSCLGSRCPNHARLGDAGASRGPRRPHDPPIDPSACWHRSPRTSDVFISGDERSTRVANDDAAIDALARSLAARAPTLIVMEATGGYQRRLLAELLDRGLPAVAVNPRQVRDFARAMGTLEKTDAVDARLLMLFAERIKPEVRAQPDAQARRFEEVLSSPVGGDDGVGEEPSSAGADQGGASGHLRRT